MSHSGNSEDVEELEKLMDDKEMVMNLFHDNKDDLNAMGQNPDEEFVQKVPIEDRMNCVILLNGGKLFMEECMIALKYWPLLFLASS